MTDRDEALLERIEAGDAPGVSSLLSSGADPNAANEYGRTALMYAVKAGHADAARLLAEQTMLGTAAFLRQSQMDLGEFIAGVATPGGTTAAGMEVMRASDFGKVVAATLKAAADRSAELGK